MLDFGGNARATHHLAEETKQAGKRVANATSQNTEAIKALAKIAEQMPAEIGDNLPKYSEREMRELRKELERVREQATAIYRFQEGLCVYIEPSNFGRDLDLKLIIHEGIGYEAVEIEDVSFDDRMVSAKLKYNPKMPRMQFRQAQKINRNW